MGKDKSCFFFEIKMNKSNKKKKFLFKKKLDLFILIKIHFKWVVKFKKKVNEKKNITLKLLINI